MMSASAEIVGGEIAYLVSQARNEISRRIGEKLKPLDLTMAQFVILSCLVKGRASTPSAFCQLLNYDPGAMTRLLQRMESKGLIRRVRSGEDQRTLDVTLTEEGQALYPHIVPLLAELYREWLGDFSDEDLVLLERLLRRLSSGSAAQVLSAS